MTTRTDPLHRTVVGMCRAYRAHAGELLGELGIHVGQEMILMVLWEDDGLTQTQLAERLGVQPPTVTRMVQRMEASGLLKRRACRSDARISHIFLTQRGHEVRPGVERVWERLEEELTNGMTREERTSFRGLLERARENLNPDGRCGA